ncbi:hypothetical protein V8G54_001126 [Vigna mungo]|uniref:Uncharacterized protein n=1 Tax=Vigna mungo TaxID=3915 RepID=A0AAQ3P8G2_VIGMU
MVPFLSSTGKHICTKHCASTMGLRTTSLWISVGKLKGNPFSSSRLKCIIGSGGFGIPPRYCNIKGIAIAGSMFPTITTVKVDGSLKHVLKNSQAFRGSTFCRSLFLIGRKK